MVRRGYVRSAAANRTALQAIARIGVGESRSAHQTRLIITTLLRDRWDVWMDTGGDRDVGDQRDV
jgi:hypothetical protein